MLSIYGHNVMMHVNVYKDVIRLLSFDHINIIEFVHSEL